MIYNIKGDTALNFLSNNKKYSPKTCYSILQSFYNYLEDKDLNKFYSEWYKVVKEDSHLFDNEMILTFKKIVQMSIKDSADSLIYEYLMIPWKYLYIKCPPTIQEFLTPEWIGAMGRDLYDHIRENFINFFDEKKDFHNLYLSIVIGWGKSIFSTLVILFIMVRCVLIKNKRERFISIAETSDIFAVMGSFKLAKAKKVLLTPFLKILKNSPKFKQVKFQEQTDTVQKTQFEQKDWKIVWSRATPNESFLGFSNSIYLYGTSDAESLLGDNIICGAFSELSFFLKAGVSLDSIIELMNEIRNRIRNRFGMEFMGRAIFDSSPYTWDSPLDKYVFSGEAEKNPENMVIRGIKHWELPIYKYKYPKYFADPEKNSFTIFTGSAGKPTRQLFEHDDLSLFSPQEVIKVPIELFESYKEGSEKVVRDFLGIPSNSEDKLVSDFRIIEQMFDDRLRSIIDSITAPANLEPKKLIFDKVKDKFFVKLPDGRYELYRYPQAVRFLSVDQSIINDTTCISMCHNEMDNKGNKIAVNDFNIVIVPTKEKINLDAIIEFIIELNKDANIYFGKITFDRFQSEMGVQRLQRYFKHFETDEIKNIVEYLSVDVSMAPGLVTISNMKLGFVKCGRNIFLKNNIKSLHEVQSERTGKKKIDHTIGKTHVAYDGHWDSSLCGINMKDAPWDSFSASTFCAINDKRYYGIWQNIEVKEVLKDVIKDKNNSLNPEVKKVSLSDIQKADILMRIKKDLGLNIVK